MTGEQHPASQPEGGRGRCSSGSSGSSDAGVSVAGMPIPDHLNATTDINRLLIAAIVGSLRASFPLATGHPEPDEQPEEQRDERSRCDDLGGSGGLLMLRLPSLSLHHETHFADREDRKQVEEYAACLLSRPLVVGGTIKDGDGEQASGSGGGVLLLQQALHKLLENAAESFAVLVDCRLRAYATFLARHGIALAEKSESDVGVISIEQKVATLLDVGKSIRAHTIELQFQEEEEEDIDGCGVGVDEGEDEEEEGSEDGTTTVPLTLRVDMKLELTRPSGAKDVLPVVVEAPGTAKLLNSAGVEIALDTRRLLEAMIEQASRVVAAVVDVANTSSLLAESKLSRSSSFLAMPPPSRTSASNKRNSPNPLHPSPPHHRPVPKSWLHAADASARESNSADRHPVVSPDTRAVAAAPGLVPALDLGHSDPLEGDDLEDLTPEDCADIIDGILADWCRSSSSGNFGDKANSNDEVGPPHSKKPRLVA